MMNGTDSRTGGYAPWCLLLLALPVIGFSQSRSASGTGTEGAIEIVETTNPVISGHQVAVGNIWERELPDINGAVAMRMSASLSVMCIETGEEWSQFVILGDMVTLGEYSYRIDSIDPGGDSRGSITLVEEQGFGSGHRKLRQML